MAVQRSKSFDPGFDELQLFAKMLMDPFVNHELDRVIKTDAQVLRVRYPDDMGKYPGMAIMGGGWRSSQWNEPTETPDEVADIFTKIIVLDIYMMENQEIQYDNKVFEGAETALAVIRDIVLRIVAENQDYEHVDLPGITFDFIEPIAEVWAQQYIAIPDASAVQLRFLIQFEKVRN